MNAKKWMVVIVDDCVTDRIIYRRYLNRDSDYSYEIVESETGEEGLELALQLKPDLILLDFLLPDMDGLEFLNRLRNFAQMSQPQILMLTGEGNEAIALQAIKANIQDYLVKGQITAENFRRAIHQALKFPQKQRQQTDKRTILIVDDSSVDRKLFRGYLLGEQDYTYEILECETGRDALKLCQQFKPDVVLLDYMLPDMNGLELIHQCRANLSLAQLPIVMVTGHGNETLVVQALKSGAQDYLVKTNLTPTTLRQSIKNTLQQTHLQNQLTQSQEQQRLIGAIALRIRQFFNLQEILDSTVEEVRRFLMCDRVVVFQFATNMSGKIVAESVDSHWSIGLGSQIEDTCFQTGAAIPYRHGRKRAIANIYEAQLTDCYIQLLEQFQVKANLVVPILLTTEDEVNSQIRQKTGSLWQDATQKSPLSPQLWGLLIAHQCSHPRQWKPLELEFLEELAVQMAVGIQQALLFEQIQQANIKLQQAKDTAETANRTKSQFLANMTHELRTPLNAILGFAQVINRDAYLPPQQQEYLNIILQSGDHLLKLINSILDMTKIEAGKMSLDESNFDLHRLLNNLQEMFQLEARYKGLQLSFERTPEVPQYIRADESKLRQVLINLIKNAIKFTQTGSVSLLVKLQTPNLEIPTHSPYSLNFEVCDTGCGIVPEELEAIFETFVQSTAGQKSEQGTGLGLAISCKFVEIMGGRLTVKSALGQGTSFAFDILVVSAQGSDRQSHSCRERVIGIASGQPSYRILIVEDQWENRYLLLKLLKPLGFELYETDNGQDAIALWELYSPHLILMDMRMPVMDGYEATRQIRAKESRQREADTTERQNQDSEMLSPTPQTVIIALTASVLDEKQPIVRSVGCDDFIRKPFPEFVLLEAIAQHLGVRYLYQDSATSPPQDLEEIVAQFTSETLSQMPPEWLSQLHLAALHGDLEQTMFLIEQIPDSLPNLKRFLTDFAHNFEFDTISNLTQLCLHE